MSGERARVQNASAPRQVRRAAREEKDADRRAQLDARAVMRAPEGRRFVWWLLHKAGIHSSVLRDGEARALYWAGRQDMGHELQAHIIATDADAYLVMQQEAIEAQKVVAIAIPEEEAGMLSEPGIEQGEGDE